MNATRRQRHRAEGRNLCSGSLARLACLCCALQRGTGFVGHLPRGPSIAASAAAAGRHHQQSWSSTLRTSHQREQLGTAVGSAAGEPRTSSVFARSRSSLDGRSNRVEPAAPAEMVGAAAASARRGATTSTTALALAAAGTSPAGAELASDAPAKKPKKRGRPRKVPLVPDAEPVSKSTSDVNKEIAEAATAGRAAAVAAAGQDDDAVRTTRETAAVKREDVEATIREEGAPTVVTTNGFVPLEDDLDADEDEEKAEEEEGRGGEEEGGVEEGGEEEEGEGDTKAKRAAKGKKAKGKGGKADAAIAEEEARQDKQAADIKVRSAFTYTSSRCHHMRATYLVRYNSRYTPRLTHVSSCRVWLLFAFNRPFYRSTSSTPSVRADPSSQRDTYKLCDHKTTTQTCLCYTEQYIVM